MIVEFNNCSKDNNKVSTTILYTRKYNLQNNLKAF